MTSFRAISWYLPEEIKENHKEPQVSDLRLEPGTARIPSSNSAVMGRKNTSDNLEYLIATPDGNFVCFCHLMGMCNIYLPE
jgi:hypothetical protein